MLFNESGKRQADIDAEKTVEHYLKKGVSARLASKFEDMTQKFDIIVGGVKIDLKRINGFYCEIDKLQASGNKADRVWMIVNDNLKQTYSIKKQALIDICAEFIETQEDDPLERIRIPNPKRNNKVKYILGKSCGDKLAYFDINMLNKDDVKIVNMSWLT